MHGISLGIDVECEPGECFDLRDLELIGTHLLAEKVSFLQTGNQLALTLHESCREQVAVSGAHHGHFPKALRKLQASARGIIVLEDRPCEDGQLDVVGLRVIEQIVLKLRPDLLVEIGVLWRTVREVERVSMPKLRTPVWRRRIIGGAVRSYTTVLAAVVTALSVSTEAEAILGPPGMTAHASEDVSPFRRKERQSSCLVLLSSS